MCEPTTLAAVAIGTSVLGAGVGALGAYQQSQAQAASAQYQAQVARNNATIAKQNADLALRQGEVAEQAQRQKTAQLIGQARTNMAAQGRTLDSGSALDIQSSAAETGELNALTIRHNAQLKSRDFLNQSNSFTSQAGLLDAQADWAEQAGYFGVGSSILGGASGVSDKWLTYKQKGWL